MSVKNKDSALSTKLKSAKPSSARTSSSKRKHLSAEYVIDQSSGDDTDQAQGTRVVLKTPFADRKREPSTNGLGGVRRAALNSASSSSDESSEEEESSDDSSERSSEGPTEVAEPKMRSSSSDTESESTSESTGESGDESDSAVENIDSQEASPVITNSQRAKQKGSLSDSSGSADTEDTSSPENDNEGDSPNGSEEADEELMGQTKNGKTVAARGLPQLTKTKQSESVQLILPARPEQAFAPPPGFKPITDFTASRVAHMVKDAETVGSRIWYITAPASVPLTELREVDLSQVARGSTVFSHNDQEYIITEDTEGMASRTRVVIPDDDRMRIPHSNITEVFHIRQVARLPAKPQAVPSFQAPERVRPRKEQPKGLKMRYRPSGFGDDDPGNIGSPSDSEWEASPSKAFRHPPSVTESSPSKKRKERKEHDGSQKKKKHKRRISGHEQPVEELVTDPWQTASPMHASSRLLEINGKPGKPGRSEQKDYTPKARQRIENHELDSSTRKKKKKRHRDDLNVSINGGKHHLMAPVRE